MTRKLLPLALILAFCCLTPGWAEKQAPTRMAGTKTEAGAPEKSKTVRDPLTLARIANSGVMLAAGATLDEYRGFGLEGAAIDLALVHFWFPLGPNMAKLLQEVLRPAHVGLTHLPIRLEGDAPSKIDMVRKYYKDIFLLLPGLPAKTFREGQE